LSRDYEGGEVKGEEGTDIGHLFDLDETKVGMITILNPRLGSIIDENLQTGISFNVGSAFEDHCLAKRMKDGGTESLVKPQG
jgi:hypothetical protein